MEISEYSNIFAKHETVTRHLKNEEKKKFLYKFSFCSISKCSHTVEILNI